VTSAGSALSTAQDCEKSAQFCNAFGAHATTIDVCRIGLGLDPENAMLHVYRACAYDELGQLAEAVADCEAAVRLDPRGHAAVSALITLALVRERLGDSAAAYEAAHAAITIEPADREAHALLGTLHAWHGEYPAAWPALECHWMDERLWFMRRFPDLAEWNGESIRGRRLLLVHGQGLGDMLQMLRYVPRLRERGAHVLLECPAPMIDLARAFPGLDGVFLNGTAPCDRYDAFARMMSLPRLCDEDAAYGASGAPYVVADATRTSAWAQRLMPRDGRLRIGIAWAGNPVHQNDRRRSIPLDAFAPLAALPNVDWFALQVGPRANDAAPSGFALTRMGDGIGDVSDTAAIVAQLDLVIAADTSVAHLAGAMGVPVWLLLPWRPDWRWSPSAHDTPWYPSMRLFHATQLGWTPVMTEVAGALQAQIRSA
jgi:Tetratricopeptide repeat